jgi:hypothetical protein
VKTAREKIVALENEVRTPEEDRRILEGYYSGKICLMRRAPTKCICGEEMWQQYIGHKDSISEWYYRCNVCGYELFG